MADEDARTVAVVDLPLAMIVITSFFVFISVLSNSTRAYVKISSRATGLDDYLVLFSQVAFVAILATTIKAALSGIGTRNRFLNDFTMVESQKWYYSQRLRIGISS